MPVRFGLGGDSLDDSYPDKKMCHPVWQLNATILPKDCTQEMFKDSEDF